MKEMMDNEILRLRAEAETERMRLAACGVAARANTEASRAERIDSTSPYYSASYADVCDAVDREIALRAEVERLRREVEVLRQFGNKDCTAMADDLLSAERGED